jgi:hypothetical protein
VLGRRLDELLRACAAHPEAARDRPFCAGHHRGEVRSALLEELAERASRPPRADPDLRAQVRVAQLALEGAAGGAQAGGARREPARAPPGGSPPAQRIQAAGPLFTPAASQVRAMQVPSVVSIDERTPPPRPRDPPLAFPFQAPPDRPRPGAATLGGRSVAYRPRPGRPRPDARAPPTGSQIAQDDLFTDVGTRAAHDPPGDQIYLRSTVLRAGTGLDRLKAATRRASCRRRTEFAEKVEASARPPCSRSTPTRNARSRRTTSATRPSGFRALALGEIAAASPRRSTLHQLWRSTHARDDARW